MKGRPLTVAMFSESYLPRISGVVTSIESFSRALRADGHRVLIIAPTYRRFSDVDPDVLRLPSIVPPGQPDFPLAVPYRPASSTICGGGRWRSCMPTPRLSWGAWR
jgi:hypothetical protein